MKWLLPIFIFAVWYLWLVACVSEAELKNVKEARPKDERRGVSIFPGIPLFPLFFWGVAFGLDRWINPWGTIIVGGFHFAYGTFLIFSINRDRKKIWALQEKEKR